MGKNQWPLVYFIQNEKEKVAYVGESTNAAIRIKNHLTNSKKVAAFNSIIIVGSDKFNKSATLDIESNLIQYITAEGTYRLQNANYGLVNHTYYQKDLYRHLFREIWTKLVTKKIVSRSLEEIENSELFNYSPYKSLNEDQYNSVIEILEGLNTKHDNRIFITGSAGTGKTILATYLVKLLTSDLEDTEPGDLNEDELLEIKLVAGFQKKYPNAKIGLVIAMTSLRKSLQHVFRKIPGLNASMIVSPSETVSMEGQYDLLIVDEAHRLRQYKSIGWMKTFRRNNEKLGLGDEGTELDWILAKSKNQIFFYDPAQSVRPSDVYEKRFSHLLQRPGILNIELKSQMRVKGGIDYISFVDSLLNVKRKDHSIYQNGQYDLFIFDSLKEMHARLTAKEKTHGLCRMVAGYAWPWASKKDKTAIDIKIDGLEFQWNQTDQDWVNSPSAFREVGCIHTTQGYDLNYTGVIFGEEISFNPVTRQIEIDPKKYFDINGKKGAGTIEDLKAYIINIYKTIMYRGIRGTYIYACDENLRNYLKQHIPTFATQRPFRLLPPVDVKAYVNCIPLIDIQAAAGDFTSPQNHSSAQWVEPPVNVMAREGIFICKVTGESMNKRIPGDSWCLFSEDNGGSREGKIVLLESTDIQDTDFGSGYTVKEYHSNKIVSAEGWSHTSITLKPLSNDPGYLPIVLKEDELTNFKVVGIFERVLYPAY